MKDQKRMESMSDRDLCVHAHSGDNPTALDILRRRLFPAALPLLDRGFPEGIDHVKVLETALKRTINASIRGKDIRDFGSYFKRVVWSVAVDYADSYRREAPTEREATSSPQGGYAINPEDAAIQNIEKEKLWEDVLTSLSLLSPKQRHVFIYREVLELSPKETAALLSTTPKIVKHRLSEAWKNI